MLVIYNILKKYMFIDFGKNKLKPEKKKIIRKRLEVEMALRREKINSTVILTVPKTEKDDPWFITSFL